MDIQNKIDIVIPWVDPTDKEWIADKMKYSPTPQVVQLDEDKFYRDWNTLKYLLRSIEKNMPWVNKIHFLTYGHIPSWMRTDHPKLKIHNHASFFKSDHAFPVFSSDAIEMNLSQIPELTEKFIYFNDDELVVKPVEPSRFFKEDIPVDFLIQDLPRGGWLYRVLRTKDVYPDICKNCLKPLNGLIPKSELRRKDNRYFFDSSYTSLERIKNLFFNLFRNYYWVIPNHAPQPLLKSTIKKCEELYPRVIKETANSRFRSSKDICHYLFRNYNLLTGEFYPHNYGDAHCIVLSNTKESIVEIEGITQFTFVCINDSEFLTRKEYIDLKPILEEKLLSLFPEKSSFEI